MTEDLAAKARTLGPGDIVCLTDEQTISDLLEAGCPQAISGLQLEVIRVRHVREQNGLCDWYVADLSGQPADYPALFLLAKAVDQELELRVYSTPTDLASARTRGDLIADGVYWMFQEPENTSSFAPCDLCYADSILEETDDGAITFVVKGGELHGEYRELPEPAGMPMPLPATIVEYRADRECDNPEVLILDVGGLDEYGERVREGGAVHYFQGVSLRRSDIHIIKASRS